MTAHLVRELATKPDYLSSVPKTRMVERTNFCTLSSPTSMCTLRVPTQTHTHGHVMACEERPTEEFGSQMTTRLVVLQARQNHWFPEGSLNVL